MKILIASAFALFSSVAMAAAEEKPSSEAVIAVAESYLAAYSTFEMEKIEPFLTDDMTFNDPTSAGQAPGGGAFQFEGKTQVLKELGTFADSNKSFSVDYDVERRYESAGVVVFVAQLNYEGETHEGQKFAGAAPIVTAVTVTDGKISAHYDFFDYLENAVDFSD